MKKLLLTLLAISAAAVLVARPGWREEPVLRLSTGGETTALPADSALSEPTSSPVASDMPTTSTTASEPAPVADETILEPEPQPVPAAPVDLKLEPAAVAAPSSVVYNQPTASDLIWGEPLTGVPGDTWVRAYLYVLARSDVPAELGPVTVAVHHESGLCQTATLVPDSPTIAPGEPVMHRGEVSTGGRVASVELGSC